MGQYVDLLFFDRDFNCLVTVELKRGPFKTAYLGQLSGYLRVLDDYERREHENPSIGLVLCKDMNRVLSITSFRTIASSWALLRTGPQLTCRASCSMRFHPLTA